MYNMLDATMPWLVIFVCISVVIFCGFFLVNVILAVLSESISTDELEDAGEIKRRSFIQTAILRAQSQKQRLLIDKITTEKEVEPPKLFDLKINQVINTPEVLSEQEKED